MCGDTEIRCKCNLDVGEVGPAIDTLRGIMVVSSNEKVDLSCGVSGKLVTVMSNVVTLREVCDVIAGCNMKRLLKRV